MNANFCRIDHLLKESRLVPGLSGKSAENIDQSFREGFEALPLLINPRQEMLGGQPGDSLHGFNFQMQDPILEK